MGQNPATPGTCVRKGGQGRTFFVFLDSGVLACHCIVVPAVSIFTLVETWSELSDPDRKSVV